MSPLWLILTAVISFAVAWLLAKADSDAQRQDLARKLRRAEAETRVNQSAAERILGSIELGVLAYNEEGKLVSANRAARLLIPRPPKTFRDFLERYGQDASFRSSIFLGSPLALTIYRQETISLRLQVQSPDAPKLSEGNRIVLIQDYSRQDKEELMRREFVANVSHELKTPLTTIKTYSESLLDWGIDEKSAEAVKKDMQRIYDDAERMEKLISDLLLLSSLDARGLLTHFEQGDPAWLIRQTVERMQYQAEEKGMRLDCQVMNKIPPVYLDRTALERIATNLISNAIKYSSEGTAIQVYIGAVREDVYFKVKDHGLGISQEDCQHLFERFFRVDSTGSRRHGGTGLGLAIVQELVELHRGRIDVQSVLGQGSEFTVILPTARKVLRETLQQLKQQRSQGDAMAEAAAADLSSLASKLDIVAKWTSLSHAEERALESLINSDAELEPELAARMNLGG